MVRSCLLITLIKCLKGHKSLDSLCTVVKPLIVSLVRQRDQATTGKELKRHSRVIWALAGGKVTNGESGYSQHEDEKGKTLRDFRILERKYTIVQILNIWLE